MLSHPLGVKSGLWSLVVVLLAGAGCSDDPAAGGDDASTGRDTGGGEEVSDDADSDPADISVDVDIEDDAAEDDVVVPDVDAADATVEPDAVVEDTTSDGSASDDVQSDVEDTVEADVEPPDAVEADGSSEPADADTGSDADLPCVVPAAGDLVIAEILPSPAMGSAGDANCDGTRNAVDDEFVELVNISDRCLNLGGVSLWTESGDARVTFDGSVQIEPGGAVVVFGGGAPLFDGTSTQTETHCGDLSACDVTILTSLPGSLALAPNDSFSVRLGETVLDSVTWGTDGVALTANQSLVRESLSTSAAFVNHDQSDRGNIGPGLVWATGICYGE